MIGTYKSWTVRDKLIPCIHIRCVVTDDYAMFQIEGLATRALLIVELNQLQSLFQLSRFNDQLFPPQ